jgi:hypothetical protein
MITSSLKLRAPQGRVKAGDDALARAKGEIATLKRQVGGGGGGAVKPKKKGGFGCCAGKGDR